LKKDEELQEYYLAMRELASQGSIDAESYNILLMVFWKTTTRII